MTDRTYRDALRDLMAETEGDVEPATVTRLRVPGRREIPGAGWTVEDQALHSFRRTDWTALDTDIRRQMSGLKRYAETLPRAERREPRISARALAWGVPLALALREGAPV